MSGEWVVACFVMYAVGSIIAGGILYEVQGSWSFEKETDMLITFGWPVTPIAFVLLGVVWCLSWLGRGPVRLVRHIIRRRAAVRLPEARILRKAS